MRDERRAALRRRYLRLGTGELAAAAVFIGVALGGLGPRLRPPEGAALGLALAPLVLVLAQGGGYWLLARRWVLRGRMPVAVAATYRCFRALDLALLVVAAVGVAVWWPDRTGIAALTVAVLSFAVVEYLNYFVVRLAYPAGRWFTEVGRRRTPRLMRDVAVGLRPSG